MFHRSAVSLDGPPTFRRPMWPGLYRHHLIGFVGVVVGHFRHLQDLGQNISPLFPAADRSRPNLGVSFKFGVETFGERTNREPSIGLRYLDLMRSSTVVLSFGPQWTHQISCCVARFMPSMWRKHFRRWAGRCRS